VTSSQEGATTTVSEVRIRKRRIVERPRLFALLDESKARVRMLVAPAGYGKTTLAEQWIARDGRIAAWYTARSSAMDVAALALGLARCSTTVVEDCDERLREHLRALPAPGENVETLAEILAEDLADWPRNAWLVVDDYHEVAREPRAEKFVESLARLSTIQFLIASRQRPAWAKSKRILYGDVLELNQTSLAMDNTEAADVLIERSASSASGLVAIANGWPAVIGLASVSSAEIESDVEQVPESLYRFFAEEVFAALGQDVQSCLTTLSVAPVLDHDLVAELLGVELAELATARTLDVGILVERGPHLDLHPLARAFLEEKSGQLGLVPGEGASATCLAHYRRCRDWDAAFDVIARTASASELEPLLAVAIDDLLDAGRLSTLQRWCDFAFDAELEAPLFALARAEVMLRHGRHIEAIAHAESAASVEGEHTFRALCIAGRAAHLASHEEQALELFRRAAAAASSEDERRDALWGQLLALIELESADADETLEGLRTTVNPADPRQFVRASAYALSHQLKFGNLDLDEADAAGMLVTRVRDPILVSSFQSTYSTALGLAARYSEALGVADSFTETVRRYRLDFATPYAHASAALAYAGLRQWVDADERASLAIGAAIHNRDGHAHQLCAALWMRILVQQGRPHEAIELEAPTVRDPLPGARAEVVSSRALALAVADRLHEAQECADTVRELSKAIEPTVLIAAVDAIFALKEHDVDAVDRVTRFEEIAFDRGALDLIVTVYRSTPELLAVLLRTSTRRDRLVGLIRRVGDQDLAELTGERLVSGGDLRNTLSPREREVYELVTQGLTNREIAKLLFIEESTVKVHVHHIYDKLGVRSRLALTVQARLERSGQATSATGGSASSGPSSVL
jgi:ATP/maltotriose-dependent transcriptional regulator MalT